MSYEVALLSFGLLSFALVGTEIMFTYATQGFRFGFSANRPNVEFSPFAIRLKKSYQNQVECASYAVPILLAAMFLQVDSAVAETAAAVFVVSRALYTILYWTGMHFVRVPAFLAAQMALLTIIFFIVKM